MNSRHALFGAYRQQEFMLRDDSRVLSVQDNRVRCDLVARYDTPAMRTLLLNLDREINLGSFKLFKQDKTTTVGYTSRDGQKLLIKRYNTKNLWHGVRRLLRRSRAENCFHMARLVRQSGINTPAPIAYVEERFGPLKGRSWFISEFVEGPHCLEYICHQASDQEVRTIAQHIGQMLAKLSQLKVTHGDLKATNILLRNNRAPWIIDLDAMKQHVSDKTFDAARQKDRNRFLKNWQHDAKLKMRFERINW